MLALARRTRAAPVAPSIDAVLVAGLVVLALGVTAIPYLYGYASSPPDRLFLGSVGNPGDANTYLAWMRQAAQGRVLFQNPYTPEAGPSEYFNLLWLVLGQAAGIVRVDPSVIYQFSRLILGALFLAAAYRFTRFILVDHAAAWLAFVLIAFGSGLGWVLRLIEVLTHRNLGYGIDYWVPEAFGFFSLLFFPHFIASLMCILGAFWGMLRALELDDRRYAVLAGVFGLALALFHLYDVVTVGVVIVVYCLLSVFLWRTLPLGRAIRQGLVFGVITGLGLGLYAVLAVRSSLLSTWAGQNVLPSPAPASYLVGFGVIVLGIPFALARVRSAPQVKDRERFLWVWLVVGLLLVYAPVPFNRRFVEGLQFPVVILGAVGLVRGIVPRLGSIFERAGFRLPALALVVTLAIVLSLPTDFVVLARTVDALSYHAAGYYLTRSDEQAYQWLDQHAAPAGVVLASEISGNELPRFADVRVFLGHQQLTYDYAAKKSQLLSFFSNMTDPAREDLIGRYRVGYVLWGNREKALGSYNPEAACYLNPVAQFGSTIVYQTRPCPVGELNVR